MCTLMLHKESMKSGHPHPSNILEISVYKIMILYSVQLAFLKTFSFFYLLSSTISGCIALPFSIHAQKCISCNKVLHGCDVIRITY